ncbi:NHL repeat-containing protein [bacterium]|nr:NHL repeat-containing protein [bacterium]
MAGIVCIATDIKGYVYAMTSGSALILKINQSGRTVASFGHTEKSGHYEWGGGIAIDSNGSIYVICDWPRKLVKLNLKGQRIAEWNLETGKDLGTFPNYVTVDRKGDIYISGGPSEVIHKYDSSGKLLAKWGKSEQVKAPGPLVVDSEGSVYILDVLGGVRKFTSSGEDVGEVILPKKQPNGHFAMYGGLAIDTHDNLYVTDPTNGYIRKYDMHGKHLADWYAGKEAYVNLIAVGPHGDIYVSDCIPLFSDCGILHLDALGKKLSRWPNLDKPSWTASDR